MTVRTAELLVAVILGILSIGIMWKSTELYIGWVKGSGPGGGAWPFWLGAGMLLCSLWTIVRWFRGVTPQSRSSDPFMSAESLSVILPIVVGLVALLLMTHFIGIYFAIFFFMIGMVRYFGRHGWLITLILAIAAPVVIFVLFEWLLTTELPKGISEPLFYPLYDLMYSS